jgi:hypothetical protein
VEDVLVVDQAAMAPWQRRRRDAGRKEEAGIEPVLADVSSTVQRAPLL